MLDIKFIRENSKEVKDACRKKRLDASIVDKLLEVDKKRLELLQAFEDMRAKKNRASESIQKAKTKEERDAIILGMQELDKNNDRIGIDLKEIEKNFQDLMLYIPNIPSEDSPLGGEEANKEVERWGEIPEFNFPIKDHIQLGKDLDLIDVEAGTKTGGFRGYYLKNEAVLLHLGLMWYAISKMREKGFNLFVTPTIVREFALIGSGHFPAGKEEVFQIGNPGKLESGKEIEESMFLAGTAEPSLLAYYSDKVLDEKDLPLKACGISPCYRSEIGSYGKDTKGLYRVHEFMKVEQIVICKADINESNDWLEEMRKISQEILKDLKLSHRVLSIAAGDMGMGKYKMYDIETWMPSRKAYGETHSDSNLTDWQTRRLNIRYREKSGEIKYAYALNNTVLASPRILIPILETYQQNDGSVKVPEVLQKFLNFKVISKK